MSDDADAYAKVWLAEWIAKKISPAPFLQQRRLASDYVSTCMTDGAKQGVTRRELERAGNGDLAAYLENAIEDKQDIEVRKNRRATREEPEVPKE